MQNSSKNLGTILAGIFAILFVATTALTFALQSIERSAFDARLYLQALDQESVYQRLADELSQELIAAAGKAEPSNPLFLLRNLSDEEWTLLLDELLPPEELKILTEDIVTQIMAYINGESDELTLSLSSLKKHLSSPEGINSIYRILKAQPNCTAEQLAALALGQQNMILCSPPDTFLFFDLRPIIEAEINAVVAIIPEKVILISSGSDQLKEVQNLLKLRMIMRLSPLFPMFFLLMISILTIRSPNDWLKWWGYPFMVAGLFSISLSAVIKPLAITTFQIFITPLLPETLSPGLVNIFKNLMTTIIYNALLPIMESAGIMVFVGLLMVAISFGIGVWKKNIEKER